MEKPVLRAGCYVGAKPTASGGKMQRSASYCRKGMPAGFRASNPVNQARLGGRDGSLFVEYSSVEPGAICSLA